MTACAANAPSPAARYGLDSRATRRSPNSPDPRHQILFYDDRGVGKSLARVGNLVKGHPEIVGRDYAVVEVAIDRGVWFEDWSEHHVQGFVRVGRQWWKVVLKRTEDLRRIYMVSMHKVEERKMVSARRNHAVIRDG